MTHLLIEKILFFFVFRSRLQVIGWYHSHPKITVWPSHVDLRTQENYQALDSCFVGLIFSVFVSESSEFKMVAFQATQDRNGLAKEIRVPIEIQQQKKPSSHVLAEMTRLPEVLVREEEIESMKSGDNDGDGMIAMIKREMSKTILLVSIQSVFDSTFISELQADLVKVLDHVSLPLIEHLDIEAKVLSLAHPNPKSNQVENNAATVKSEAQNHGDQEQHSE